MKVKRLTLRSFRGIDNLTLDFDPKVNVLIGNNGVGKSSVLECIAIFLSSLTRRIQTPNNFVPPFPKEQDISIKRTEAKIGIEILTDELEVLPLFMTIGDEGLVKIPDEALSKIDSFADFIYSQLKLNSKFSLPSAVYYRSDRVVSEISLESLDDSWATQIDTYQKAITGEKTDFASFFLWFKKVEDLENELRLNDDHSYRDRQLEAVRKAIPEFLPGFSNLRVRRSPLRMTVQKQGQELIINQLSDGEKCLLAMVGDLARRLAIANPGLPDPLQGEGVVLIDEIELHLHPNWQRDIVPALTKTFPNCQFILTTHSPQVLGEIKGKVYRLKSTSDGIIAESIQTYGRDSSEILEDEMEADRRSVKIKEGLMQLFRLIEDGNLEAARELKRKMSEEIGDDESEFVKAEILIRRYEVLGR
ncbi:AAA family ATPase [Phormidesmis priestleyi]